MTVRASIIGGSGFVGGELARLLLQHPLIELGDITSRQYAGKPIHAVHPNLRGHVTDLFVQPDEIGPSDVLFLCMPHGRAAQQIDDLRERARVIVDCSADFRLRDADTYARWYERAHPAPHRLAEAVYGLPELERDRLGGARLISGVGCNATAMNLALLPLARAGLIDRVIADIKVGSSEAGAEAGPSSHHPVRSRAVRTYSPSRHRHIAEVEQALGRIDLDATVTAIEMVRGVLCTAHVTPTRRVDQRELFRLYRETYADEPFVRIVRDRSGLHRLPDPRVLAGSNHADVGFAIDEHSGRIVALCAIDNLMKGAAGSALQSLNLALDMPETAGLGFPGLHPA